MVSFCYGDIMSKEFNKLMNAHEVDDKDYVYDVEAVKDRIKEEFASADEFLSYIESDEKAAKAFFDYSGSKPYLFSVIPVRKSDRLYVKKHTATQRPYYHSHAFYEIIFVQNGKRGKSRKGIYKSRYRIYNATAFYCIMYSDITRRTP